MENIMLSQCYKYLQMSYNPLSLIEKYNLNEEEAKAWKVCILYMNLIKKYGSNLRKYRECKGDPRKTGLFKYCYKLVREYNLKDHEYKFYLQAQMQILGNIDRKHGTLMTPNCLVGEKAWKRWLVWKNKVKKTLNASYKTAEEAGISNNKEDVINQLKKTREFLQHKLKTLDKERIISNLNNRNILKWTVLGLISGYYLAFSPIVSEWLESTNVDLFESFSLDLNYYKRASVHDIESSFKEIFDYEY